MLQMKKYINIILLTVLSILYFGCDDSNDASAPIETSGQGGSLARFTIVDNQLYVVNDEELITFDISDPSKVEKASQQNIGFGIETIFPFRDNLFIGSESAMYIYDITDPLTPEQVSIYPHITNCDPVVVQGNFAYSTLRGSANCRFGGQDRVEIVNIEDLFNPVQVSIFQDVITPYGLGIKDNILYVCQGDFGLKLIDVEDPERPESLFTLDVSSTDVIVDGGRLILTGSEGIYQYDISVPDTRRLLSKIDIGL